MTEEKRNNTIVGKFNHRAEVFFRGWHQWDQSPEHKYVQALLRGMKAPPTKRGGVLQKLIYDSTSFYKFHSRIISSIICGIIGLYLTILLTTFYIFPIIELYEGYLTNDFTLIITMQYFVNPSGAGDPEELKIWIAVFIEYIR
jgi:hypothetical protein